MTAGRSTNGYSDSPCEPDRPVVSLSALMKRMQVIHKGRRYWAFGPMTDGRRWRWTFWSDHKFPWFHGSITLPANDREAAVQGFLSWLPFAVEVEE